MKLSCCAGLASFVPPTVDATQLDTSAIYRSKLEKASAVLKTLVGAGCDFFEFGVGMLCPEAPYTLFDEFKAVVHKFPLQAECFNSFIPGDLKVVGPEVNRDRLMNYLGNATHRAAELNGKVIVLGSGAARSVPEGFPQHRAHDQMLEFLSLAAQYGRKYGIVIAIEHLNRSETNLINSIAEAVQYADEVALPEVKVLVDFYHMMVEGEPFEQVVNAGQRIAHVHVADTDRLYPGSGAYDYQTFGKSLAEAGYTNRISVECNFRDFNREAPRSIRFLREVFGEA